MSLKIDYIKFLEYLRVDIQFHHEMGNIRVIPGDEVVIPANWEKQVMKHFGIEKSEEEKIGEIKPPVCPGCNLVIQRCKCAKIKAKKDAEEAMNKPRNEEKPAEKAPAADATDELTKAVVDLTMNMKKAGEKHFTIQAAIKKLKADYEAKKAPVSGEEIK